MTTIEKTQAAEIARLHRRLALAQERWHFWRGYARAAIGGEFPDNDEPALVTAGNEEVERYQYERAQVVVSSGA